MGGAKTTQNVPPLATLPSMFKRLAADGYVGKTPQSERRSEVVKLALSELQRRRERRRFDYESERSEDSSDNSLVSFVVSDPSSEDSGSSESGSEADSESFSSGSMCCQDFAGMSKKQRTKSIQPRRRKLVQRGRRAAHSPIDFDDTLDAPTSNRKRHRARVVVEDSDQSA